MFVHSGASLHGHEYSRNQGNLTLRRSPLARAAFSTPSPLVSTYSTTAIRPARKLSANSQRHTASFSEPEVDAMSEDGRSFVSEGSETTSGGTKKRKRKSIRSSISYHLAHPAPTLTRQQKLLHIRPRLLLQLQRLSQDRRPIPSIDVLPATVVVPRLMKKFPRMFKGKGELGANDVIIVKSEDYDAPVDDKELDVCDDESLSNREVVAVICQRRGHPGSSEICLDDGSVWYGSLLLKGIFEFVTTDPVTGEKTAARWVQRVSPRRHSSLREVSSTGSVIPSDPKYLFSILHPNSRRHPILASLTQNLLDIPDNYTTVSSSAGRYPPTSPVGNAIFDWQLGPAAERNLERTTIPVDESMRILIQVTGVWLALRNGWCPYFKYDDASTATPVKGNSSSIAAPVVARTLSNSFPSDNGRNGVLDTRASTPDSNPSSFGGVGGKIRRSGNHIFRSSPSNISPIPLEQIAPLPRRSVSTGTAFMQRAAARRAGQPPSIVASDSEAEFAPPSPLGAAKNDPISFANRRSMPLPPPESRPIFETHETPTKPFHRRVQSVFMPSSSAPQSQSHETHEIPSKLSAKSAEDVEQLSQRSHHSDRKKGGRWNALIRFLRRG